MSDTEETTTPNAVEEVVEDLSNSDVVTKYRLASEIANIALQGAITQCVADKPVVDVCRFSDAIITKRCAAIFKSKKILKGVAFPTCVSVNEQVCHNSPLPAESKVLKAGDWVKIDLGCHIDGYIATVAHTCIVPGGEDSEKVTGKAADVMVAANQAIEVCKRMIAPGNKNTDVTKALEKVAAAYNVTAVQGQMMHQMKRFVIDGSKKVALKQPNPVEPGQQTMQEAKVEECTFEANEVYSIDICFTTNSSDKLSESEERTTVFKRQVDKNYQLKMKASRGLLAEVNNKHPTMPFTIREFEDERQARMGVVECVKHDLLQPYPIRNGKPGDIIAHFKIVLLLLSTNSSASTGLPFETEKYVSEKKIDDEELQAVLNTPFGGKKKRNKKKKAKKEVELD